MIYKLFSFIFISKIKLFFIKNIFYSNQYCIRKFITLKLFIFLGKIFHRYKNMNSSFVGISTLIKSDIGEKCLINFLMNISTQALRYYLECPNIYKGNSTKKKTDLIEMIVYGCITDNLNKEGIEDISSKQANQILNKSNITVKSLPGYGNAELKKKDIKTYVKEKTFIKV